MPNKLALNILIMLHPKIHELSHDGKRGKTFSYWYCHNGQKVRSERFKDRLVMMVELQKLLPTFGGDYQTHSTTMTADQVRHAELCLMFARQHSIGSIYEALTFYTKHHKAAVEGPKLSEAQTRFLNDKKLKVVSGRTILEYEAHFRTMREVLGKDFPTGTMTEEKAREYLGRWQAKSLLTFSHRRRTMAAFFQWLVNRKELPSNPLSGIPNPNNNGALSRGRIPELYSVDEAAALLKAARRGSLLPFFVMSLFSGMRTEEIQRLEQQGGWAKINFETGRIAVDGKKGLRVVVMNPTLRAWLTKLQKKKPAFYVPNHWQLFKDLKRSVLSAERAALPNLGRHAYITYSLALPGASYAQVSRNCGNSETIIKRHYEGHATAAQAKAFFRLLPGLRN
ncbi:MAG: hypothetical protein JNG82_13050 [Opitutaceae bacterium]|nr:hypothetical protein [Opitutaceae bacterium]